MSRDAGEACGARADRYVRGMARVSLAVLLLLGCGGADGPPIDAAMDAPWDAAMASCGPSGGCVAGPACGAGCCAAGERCDRGVCRCGENAACGAGDSCAAAGPIGGDACGAVCCGASGPCPQ